jgi:hypothetical protein
MKANPNSGQIEVIGKYGAVFLYTHEHAKNVIRTVHNVLSRRKYWDDEDYLTSMLFRELVKNEKNSETDGYGIGRELYVNANLILTLDIEKQKLCITSINDGRNHHYMDFDVFINGFSEQAEL